MKNIKYSIYVFSVLFLLSLMSCKKFLDEQSDKSRTIPTTMPDAQAILDGNSNMNIYPNIDDGSLMSDEYCILDTYFDRLKPNIMAEMTWDPNVLGDDNTWKSCYAAIVTANVALETLNKISPKANEIDAYNLAKGGAFFFRAYVHYQLALVYSLPYQTSTANQELGIPYKATSDINEPTIRPTLKDTYQKIIDDLKEAASLLPISANFQTRPIKPAALGMLARVYLSMNDYQNAYDFADSALRMNNTLLDFNQISLPSPSSTANPIPDFAASITQYNPEVLFWAKCSSRAAYFSSTNGICDTVLYASYAANDLRKFLYFFKRNDGKPNTYGFRGGYLQSAAQPFAGVATDEIYLIRAECAARLGHATDAMNDLNTLLRKRYNNTFTDLTAADASTALSLILHERRKELAQRHNMRWYDLRRLNLDPNYAETISRMQHGILYTLPPNDLRYALLIPVSVIQYSGIEQNKR